MRSISCDTKNHNGCLTSAHRFQQPKLVHGCASSLSCKATGIESKSKTFDDNETRISSTKIALKLLRKIDFTFQ